DSPARQAKIGVAEPLPPESRWPLFPEEKAFIAAAKSGSTPPDRGEAVQPLAKKSTTEVSEPIRINVEEAAQKPSDDPKTWIANAFQLDDRAKREAAIERIRDALIRSQADEERR